jgi:hypothetical protein
MKDELNVLAFCSGRDHARVGYISAVPFAGVLLKVQSLGGFSVQED